MRTLLSILVVILFQLTATACIWDGESLSREKSRSHDLAETILGTQQISDDTIKLAERIKQLQANRQENDANWWNNLAGAYLRLNRPQEAVDLLEPVVAKFPNDYGIHANLGTAYHLLGRYQDAEKEIERDLEINSNAHFGLEKYHLALLQYLVRDSKYQRRHVYVDEFTAGFLAAYPAGHFFFSERDEEIFKAMAQDYSNDVSKAEADYATLLKTNTADSNATQMLGALAAMDTPPTYRAKWNLLNDTNLEAGVIYMAQMNPKEPACFTMLGIAAWAKRDYNLAAAAFEKAVVLGSPQSELLRKRADSLRDYVRRSLAEKRDMNIAVLLGVIALCLLVFVIGWFARKIEAAISSERLSK